MNLGFIKNFGIGKILKSDLMRKKIVEMIRSAIEKNMGEFSAVGVFIEGQNVRCFGQLHEGVQPTEIDKDAFLNIGIPLKITDILKSINAGIEKILVVFDRVEDGCGIKITIIDDANGAFLFSGDLSESLENMLIENADKIGEIGGQMAAKDVP